MNLRRLLLGLWLAAGPLQAGSPPVYETLPIPPGQMLLEIPLNTYLQVDYLSVTVTVSAKLRMGRYEVSNRDWNACYQAGGCAKKAEVRDDEGPDNPVARVNWHEAAHFARWLSKTTGKRYRLPTEGEWYYVFSEGKGFKEEARSFNYSGLEELRKIPKKTWKRGKFGQNTWGIADMGGNIWEWTLSCYTLSEERLLSKPDLEALESADACSTRIVCGRSRAHVPDFIQDTYSGGCASVEPAANLGFRLMEEE